MNRTIVIVALAAALLVLPLFTNPYWTDVCVSIGLYALLALSLNVILGQAGIFHMGHAAFFAVGAYSTAILNTMYHWPIFLTMPVAGCAAALFALVVARPIIHLRGDYLLIVTIGIVEIVRIALINDVGGLTGGSNGIFGISRPVFFGLHLQAPAFLLSGLGHGGRQPAAVLRPVAFRASAAPQPRHHEDDVAAEDAAAST